MENKFKRIDTNPRKKRELLQRRIIAILEKQQPLPAREIFYRLKNDGYKRHPKNTNQLANIMRKTFYYDFEKVPVGNSQSKSEWKLRRNKNEK